MRASGEPGQVHDPAPDASPGPIGLVAGAGGLPDEAMARLGERGLAVEAFGFEGISRPGLARPEHTTRLGQIGRLAALLETRAGGKST